MSFTRDLKKFNKISMDNYRNVKRLSSFDLFSSIVITTPVDKGVLRNNWFADIGRGSTKTTTEGDIGGQGTISEIERVLQGVDVVKDVFLTNNLPYAEPIEFDGHSAQAPTGMVRVNTIRWDKIVSRHAREVLNGG